MRRPMRYGLALLVAAVVTGGVALEHHSVVLLPGVYVVYTLATAVALRYPAVVWGRDLEDRRASAAFAGGTTFGVLSLAQGLGVGFHLGAAVLGFGLVLFGASTGIWMAEASGN
mgnify:FL=1